MIDSIGNLAYNNRGEIGFLSVNREIGVVRMSFFSGTISKLENSLHYASTKNKTIANNLANIDTPGYKAKKVEFKDALQSHLSTDFQAKKTHPKHVSFGDNESNVSIKTSNSTTYNHNGNNVDVDKEMSELAKNQIYYHALVDRINGKFNSLQKVIKGGQ